MGAFLIAMPSGSGPLFSLQLPRGSSRQASDYGTSPLALHTESPLQLSRAIRPSMAAENGCGKLWTYAIKASKSIGPPT